MKNLNKTTWLGAILVLIFSSLTFISSKAFAGGISIDAGLTPAANRWIFRTQYRLMNRDNNPQMPAMEMKMQMFPIMMAYGLRSDAMVMIRLPYVLREMTMMDGSINNSNFGDLFVLGKYRLLRINTPTYTLGIAPTLGLEFPTGATPFTSDSYNLRAGMFMSGRIDSWGIDLNMTYIWNGAVLVHDTKLAHGNEFAVEIALSRQFSIGHDADIAISPVLESSYQKISSDKNDGIKVDNSGESLLIIAPGLQFTWGSFILEGVVQVPIWQEQLGSQTERATGFILGIRLMN